MKAVPVKMTRDSWSLLEYEVIFTLMHLYFQKAFTKT